MRREDIFAQVLSEKVGLPQESLVLLLDHVKKKDHHMALEEDISEEHGQYLLAQLRKRSISYILYGREVRQAGTSA